MLADKTDRVGRERRGVAPSFARALTEDLAVEVTRMEDRQARLLACFKEMLSSEFDLWGGLDTRP
jgi:hypothetical protein